MPAEHAILGLLAVDAAGSRGYGYDLARHFSEGQPLAAVLRLEPGMLYHHLKKLERAGWVESTTEETSSRPARRVYRLTAAGRGELDRWLEEPVAHTREIRLEFLVKLYFARRLDPARAGRLLAEQRAICRSLEESLSRQLDEGKGATDGSVDAAAQSFRRLVLELRIAQTRAAVVWLDQVAASDRG
jgi:DNA-binding PadR family transcriptional regulator